MRNTIAILFCSCIMLTPKVMAQEVDSVTHKLAFKGQLSSWLHYNDDNPYPVYVGARYIPQLNYEMGLRNGGMIDFEASANIYGSAGIHFFDSADFSGDINPYRLWGRYSTSQLEFRVGLQKIDFGTAVMLRALRWFDQVDPRDPLQLTDGVYGALFRYYFLNNANIWIWGLYGNANTKGMEAIKSNRDIPEFGGRIQTPVPKGEAGLSYHHRSADSRNLSPLIPSHSAIPENRLGLDAKWDLTVGLWLEASWVNKGVDMGQFTNQEIFTLGTDYTFGVGSGLGITLEHMLFANDQNAFEFMEMSNNTGCSVNYAIGMFDNIRAIVYYNWERGQVYNFVNWFRQFDKTTLYVMGYWNPETAAMPTSEGQNLYAGKGVQIMFLYNH